jgi:hypothetical protein
MMPTIELRLPGHGYYRVTTAALDATMSRYLPASPADLRAIVSEREPDIDYSEVTDAVAFLVILADWTYNVDESPLRSYS